MKRKAFLKKWLKANKNNYTRPINIFDINKVVVGNYSYGDLKVLSWDNIDEGLEIGCYCSIASGVTFILGGNHLIDNLSNFSFEYFFDKKNIASATKGPINIHDGVWIGTGATIMSGVTIGKGAIIGASAVVAKNIPSYAIAVGNPAKVIRYRFNETVRSKLEQIDYYSYIDKSYYKQNKELLNQPLTDDLLKRLSDLPNKSK